MEIELEGIPVDVCSIINALQKEYGETSKTGMKISFVKWTIKGLTKLDQYGGLVNGNPTHKSSP